MTHGGNIAASRSWGSCSCCSPSRRSREGSVSQIKLPRPLSSSHRKKRASPAGDEDAGAAASVSQWSAKCCSRCRRGVSIPHSPVPGSSLFHASTPRCSSERAAPRGGKTQTRSASEETCGHAMAPPAGKLEKLISRFQKMNRLLSSATVLPPTLLKR